jgi:hypothetical protein
MFNFEKLETWHEAIAFPDLVYQLIRNFPTVPPRSKAACSVV